MNEKILDKLLNEKYESLAQKEKDIILNHWIKLTPNSSQNENAVQLKSELIKQLHKNDNNCISVLYGCKGGFVIHRSFSTNYKKEFKIIIIDKNIEDFIKELPVKEKSGIIFNFYKILESTIGIQLNIRNAFKLGSIENGLTINGIFKIDAFEIIVAKDEDVETVIEDMRDIFKLDTKLKNIENENQNLKKIINDLKNIQNPLIITEGKTDWKHFIAALRYFHTKNEFKNIEENWFLKYGSNKDKIDNICDTNFILDCSVTELKNILSSFKNSSQFNNSESKFTKIGIFDSDDKVKIINDKNSKTYTFIIKPNNISTELLYSDEEIKTIIDSKRLYLGVEFNQKTKRHLIEKNINLGGENNSINKAGYRKIIDCDIYNEYGENIALTKEMFAQKIYRGEIKISENSWENFRHIFQYIESVI